MSDQLPIIRTNRAITVTSERSNTLIGRGLSAIQNKNSNFVIADLDLNVRYRQARDIYDTITGCSQCSNYDNTNWGIEKSEALKSCFITFQLLADQDYAKAYYPLSKMLDGDQSVNRDYEQSSKYARLAFNWCFENQFQDDPEIWNDLGMMYSSIIYVDEEDETLAFFLYEKSAEQNNKYAQYNLGWMYENYYCTEVNDEEAAYWYCKAANQGYDRTQYKLGCIGAWCRTK